MDEEYIDKDLYGRGADIIFGKGAAEQTKREALLKLKASRDAKYKIEPGEYVEWDLYGRGDPRIFGKNGHIANYEEARARLDRQQDPARSSFRNALRVPGRRIRRSIRRSIRLSVQRLKNALPCFHAQSDSEDESASVVEPSDEMPRPACFIRPPTARIHFPATAAMAAEDSAPGPTGVAIPNLAYSASKNVAPTKRKPKDVDNIDFTDLIVYQDNGGGRLAYLRARRPSDEAPSSEAAYAAIAPKHSATIPAMPQAEVEGKDEIDEAAPAAPALELTAPDLSKPQSAAQGNEKGDDAPSVVAVSSLHKVFKASDESTPEDTASARDKTSRTGAQEFIVQSSDEQGANNSSSTSMGVYASSHPSVSSSHRSATQQPSSTAAASDKFLAGSSPGSSELLSTSGSSRSITSAGEGACLPSGKRDATSKGHPSPPPQISGDQQTKKPLQVRDLARLFGGVQSASGSNSEEDDKERKASSAEKEEPKSLPPLPLTITSTTPSTGLSDRSRMESQGTSAEQGGSASKMGVTPSPRTPRSVSILSGLLPKRESPAQEDQVYESDSCSSENGRYESVSQSNSGESQEGSVGSGTSYMYSDTSGFENVSERHESVSQLGNYSSEFEVSSRSSRGSRDSSPIAPAASTSDSAPFFSLETEHPSRSTGHSVASPNRSWNTFREDAPRNTAALTSKSTSSGTEATKARMNESIDNSSSFATAEHSSGRGRCASASCTGPSTPGPCNAETGNMSDMLSEHKNNCQTGISSADNETVSSRLPESSADSFSGMDEGHESTSEDKCSAVQEAVVRPVPIPPADRKCESAGYKRGSSTSSSGSVQGDAGRPGDVTTSTSARPIAECDDGNIGHVGQSEEAYEFTPVVMIGEDIESLVDLVVDTDSNSGTEEGQSVPAVLMGSSNEAAVERRGDLLQHIVTESADASNEDHLLPCDRNRAETNDGDSARSTEYYSEQVDEVDAEPTGDDDSSPSQSTSQEERPQHPDVYVGELREPSPGRATEDAMHPQASDAKTSQSNEHCTQPLRKLSSGPTAQGAFQHHDLDEESVHSTEYYKGEVELIPEPTTVYPTHHEEPDEKSIQHQESGLSIESAAEDPVYRQLSDEEDGGRADGDRRQTEVSAEPTMEETAHHQECNEETEQPSDYLTGNVTNLSTEPTLEDTKHHQSSNEEGGQHAGAYRLQLKQLSPDPTVGSSLRGQGSDEENLENEVRALGTEPTEEDAPYSEHSEFSRGLVRDMSQEIEAEDSPHQHPSEENVQPTGSEVSPEHVASQNESEENRTPKLSKSNSAKSVSASDDDSEDEWSSDVMDPVEDVPTYRVASVDRPPVFMPISYQKRANSRVAEVGIEQSQIRRSPKRKPIRPSVALALEQYGHADITDAMEDEAFSPAYPSTPLANSKPPEVSKKKSKGVMDTVWGLAKSWNASAFQKKASKNAQSGTVSANEISASPIEGASSVLGIQYDRDTESPPPPIVTSSHKSSVEENSEQVSKKRCSSGAGPSSMPIGGLPSIRGNQYDRDTESPLPPIVSFEDVSQKRYSSGAGPSSMPNPRNVSSTPTDIGMYKNNSSGSEGISGGEGTRNEAERGREQRAAAQPRTEALSVDALAARKNSAARKFYNTPPAKGGRSLSSGSGPQSNKGSPVETVNAMHEAEKSGAESSGTEYTADFSSSGAEDSSATSGSGDEDGGPAVVTPAAPADDVMTTGGTFAPDSTDSSNEFI